MTGLLRSRTAMIAALLLGAALAGQLLALVGPAHELVPLPVLVGGVPEGALVALGAIGLLLVYRAGRYINFAQGAFGTLAASVFLTVRADEGSYAVAIISAIAVTLFAALLTDLFLMRRFAGKSPLVQIVVTIGIAQALAAVAGVIPLVRFGPRALWPNIAATSPLSDRRWEWFPETFTGDAAAAVVIALVALAAVAVFLRVAAVGLAVRASAENRDRAELLGVSTTLLSTFVWSIAAVLGATAALVQLPVAGASLTNAIPAGGAGVGVGSLLAALAAAVFARMRDLPIAVAAAVAITVFERCAFWAFSETSITDAALFAVILVGLLVQRRELSRLADAESATWNALAEPRRVPAVLAALPSVRLGIRRFWVVVGVAVAAYPWVMSPAQVNLGGLYAIYGIVGVSLVMLTGWGGQISLGQFGFVAVGAAIGGSLSAAIPFPLAALAASLVGAGVATVIGLPALRIRGLYLAVTTLSFALMTQTVLLNDRYFDWLIPDEVSRPRFLWVDFEDERTYYYLSVGALALVVFLALGLRRSRSGRVLIAMRDNERAAQAASLGLVRVRLATFAISGFFAAFAGVLFAHHQRDVLPASFGADQSILMFLMAVLGGLGSVLGVVLGAIYIGATTIFLNDASAQLLGGGAGVLAVLAFAPDGLGGLIVRLRDAWLRRVARRERLNVPGFVDTRALGTERAPLAPKLTGDDQRVEIPVRYRRRSLVGTLGNSQRERGWTM